MNHVFQSDIVNNTERIFRLADSGVLNQARFIGGITNNLESLYDVFLDHVDVRYIIAKLITCLGLPDLDPWLLELIIAGVVTSPKAVPEVRKSPHARMQ